VESFERHCGQQPVVAVRFWPGLPIRGQRRQLPSDPARADRPDLKGASSTSRPIGASCGSPIASAAGANPVSGRRFSYAGRPLVQRLQARLRADPGLN